MYINVTTVTKLAVSCEKIWRW